MANKLKILIIAEAANPEWVSVPLVGWSLASKLSELFEVHIVTQVRNAASISRAGLVKGKDFTPIDSEKIAGPLWKLTQFFRGGEGKGWTTGTAINAISYYYFEHLVWAKFSHEIKKGSYDIVHRITPLSPTIPSLISKKCKKQNVPFILGPLNGGVPWPKEFDAARRQEKEWLSYVRSAYKLLPGYRSTLKNSAALIVGSYDTYSQVPQKYHSKCIYVPENAVDPKRFSMTVSNENFSPLRLCFVGRLVPYKGPDMLIEAAAQLIREGSIVIDIFGDGPLMSDLRQLVERSKISDGVNFYGWVEHGEIQEHLCQSHVLAFPSIREFGGGVVLEAMAMGIVPLIVNYGGPGELVTGDTGYKVPIGSREEIVSNFQERLLYLCKNPIEIQRKSIECQRHVKTHYTWEAKANQISQIYKWVLNKDLPLPKFFNNSN